MIELIYSQNLEVLFGEYIWIRVADCLWDDIVKKHPRLDYDPYEYQYHDYNIRYYRNSNPNFRVKSYFLELFELFFEDINLKMHPLTLWSGFIMLINNERKSQAKEKNLKYTPFLFL